VKKGKTGRVAFKLSKTGAKALRKYKKLTVRLKVTMVARGTGGRTTSATRTIVVKMPPKRHKKRR
jgi:hypothetical protein